MENTPLVDETVQSLIDWGEAHAAIRAMILTSTRARYDAMIDAFSDYDVIVVVADIRPFYEDRSWLEDFGSVLVVYCDPIRLDHGLERFAYITQYEDGTKIDFTLWPVELLQRVAGDAELPDELDVGYAVLLDKDNLTGKLKPATYTAHIPTPPTEDVYQNAIKEFFHEATYVAKHLWRDDLMPAKYNLDQMMKFKWLRVMLEWRVEIEHDWSLKPGAYGKGLKKYLGPEIWTELQNTYVRAGIEENWEALFKTVELFRKVAGGVGDQLGYAYPGDLDRRVTEYLHWVKALKREV